MQTKQLKYLTVAAASVLIVSVAYAADKPEDSTKEPSGATFAQPVTAPTATPTTRRFRDWPAWTTKSLCGR